MNLNDGPMAWDRDGPYWPNRETSQFIRASGLKWHIQRTGDGPTCLLLHGTGASTHSWRDMLKPLARRFDVIAPDLPGHAFTDRLPFHRLSLPGMAKAVRELLEALDARPAIVVAHSAGAPIAMQLALCGAIDPKAIVCFNAALKPYGGKFEAFFSGTAKLLFTNPILPWLASREMRNPKKSKMIIANVGSKLDARGQELYDRLLRSPDHVGGALGMMASWNLGGVLRDLPRLKAPILLIASDGDSAVPPNQCNRAAALAPNARCARIPGLGHLAHEEDPALAVKMIFDEAERVGTFS